MNDIIEIFKTEKENFNKINEEELKLLLSFKNNKILTKDERKKLSDFIKKYNLPKYYKSRKDFYNANKIETKYKYFHFHHKWFYFAKGLNMEKCGFKGMGNGNFEDRICEKCLEWESRQFSINDPNYSNFSWFGYGLFAYKELLIQKVKYILNPEGRYKNGRYIFIKEDYPAPKELNFIY